jgi:hypothetical protein
VHWVAVPQATRARRVNRWQRRRELQRQKEEAQRDLSLRRTAFWARRQRNQVRRSGPPSRAVQMLCGTVPHWLSGLRRATSRSGWARLSDR